MFDIVIPVGPNDINQINNQIEYTKKNVIGYRNIYIVSYDPKIILGGCIIIDESIFPFTINDVATYHGKHSRNGWYLQQLIKLYAGFVIPDILDTYLVVDSDTYFLKPTHFIEDGKCLYNPGTEYHIPYFEHMKRLNNTFQRVDRSMSGISHHMIFQKKYIMEIIDLIELEHGRPFWIVFLEKVVDIYDSGASEYEIYFNYMLWYNPDKIKVRRLNWMNVSDINQYFDLDYVSWHWYRRV